MGEYVFLKSKITLIGLTFPLLSNLTVYLAIIDSFNVVTFSFYAAITAVKGRLINVHTRIR